MRKHGGTPSQRDKHAALVAISPPGLPRGRFVGGQQSGLAGCKPPPLFTRGGSSCSSQGRRQGEPWGASPRPSAPTYLPLTGGEPEVNQGTRGRPGERKKSDYGRTFSRCKNRRGGPVWQYQGQECPVRERREVGQGSTRDRRQRVWWGELLVLQMQKMEYEEVPEGAGKGEWNRRQGEGVDL